MSHLRKNNMIFKTAQFFWSGVYFCNVLSEIDPEQTESFVYRFFQSELTDLQKM